MSSELNKVIKFTRLLVISFFLIQIEHLFAQEIKPVDEAKRPSIMYQPTFERRTPKYPSKLGILPVIDARTELFYGPYDNFFKDPTIKSLERMLGIELNYSNLFGGTAAIKENLTSKLSMKEISEFGQKYNVDLILLSHLTSFNFNREPTEEMQGTIRAKADYVNKVKISMIVQVIDVNTGLVLFGEEITRESSAFAEFGKLDPSQLRNITVEALKNTFKDMKILIERTGATLRN